MLYADINELEKIKEQKFNENSTVKTPPFMPNPMVKLKFEEKSTKENGIIPSNTKNKRPTDFTTPINKNQNNTGNNSLNNGNFTGSNQQEKMGNKPVEDFSSIIEKNPEKTSNIRPNVSKFVEFEQPQVKLRGEIERQDYTMSDLVNHITKPFRDLKNNIIQKGAEFALEEQHYKKGGRFAAEKLVGKDTIGLLDIAENNHTAKDYTKDAIKLENYKDNRLSPEDIKYLEKKTTSQFARDGFDINKIPGYRFNSDSEPSTRIANDPDFRDMLISNKDKINNKENKEEISGDFPRRGSIKNSNLHYAIGGYDLRNAYVDDDGNFHGQVYDTYDFNEQNKTPLNQAGRTRMLDGNLKPFFTIHDIYIPKEELDKFW